MVGQLAFLNAGATTISLTHISFGSLQYLFLTYNVDDDELPCRLNPATTLNETCHGTTGFSGTLPSEIWSLTNLLAFMIGANVRKHLAYSFMCNADIEKMSPH